MKDKTLERMTVATVFVLGIAFLATFALLCWGFIEFVLWFTSK